MHVECDHGADIFHTSLACSYQAVSVRLAEVNLFSTASLAFLFLAPACHIFGSAAQRVKLPRITGYLAAGIVAGPYVLRLLDSASVSHLWFIDQACLSAIALAAGAELQLEQLDKIKKQVTYITASITVATWLAVIAVMLPMAPLLASLTQLTTAQLLAFCSLSATLMVARSPASAIAVLQETGGKGSFCSLVMAVVIVKDVVTILAFSLNIELARALLSSSGALSISTLLEPFVSLVIAMTLGLVGAGVVTGTMHRLDALARQRPWAIYVRHGVLGLLSTCVFEVAAYFHAEPLLACAMTGLLTTNTLREAEREDFHASLVAVMPGVNLAFFSLAGASLKLSALGPAAWLACIICAVRVVAVFAGSQVGSWLSGCPAEQRKPKYQLPPSAVGALQAGVALGLARMVGVRFPAWGPQFQTLMAATIILNLCLGPPLFRHAIISLGEGRTSAQKVDHSSPLASDKSTPFAEHDMENGRR